MAIATVGDDEDLFDQALKTSGKGKANQSEPADIFDSVLQKSSGGKVAPTQPVGSIKAPDRGMRMTTSAAERERGRADVLLQERQSIVDRLANPKLAGEDRRREEANLSAINREIGTLPADLRQPAVAAPVVSAAAPAPAAPVAAAPTAQPKVAGLGERLLRSGAGLADTVLGGIQALPGTAAAEIGYAGVRAGEALGLVEPGRAERGRAAVYKKFVEPYTQPVGQALGVTETPEYKGETSQQLVRLAGETINDYATRIATSLGIPKADVENMIATGTSAIPGLGGLIKREASKVFKPKAEAARVEPTAGRVEPTLEKPRMTYEEFKAQQSKKKLTEEEARAQFEAKQGRKPKVDYQEFINNQRQRQEGTLPPETPFTEVKYSEKGLPDDAQRARAEVVGRVLGEDHVVDLAAIEGKGKERATNYAASNTDTPLGEYYKERFADEKTRLANYAENQIRNTGGTIGLDESSVYKRGNTILKPLQDLETYFDDATRKIYADRDVIAKDVPVTVDNVTNTLNDRTLVEISDAAERLAKTSKVKLQQLGMMDEKGNLLPSDAYRAELFRKWLNQNWSKDANQLHKKLKAAVDEDVLAKIDQTSPLYKDARSLVELRKNTLDNPNGISRILDAEGPKGINRKVQIEKIAQNIADMPVDQFTHVIDTLRNVPEQLKPQANTALSEIKAQFANRIAEQKTPRALTNYMNSNREVMSRLFTPEEMNALRDYHDATHILATDTGYKGAGVQKINVEQKLGAKVRERLVTGGAAVAAEGLTGGVGMGVPALITQQLLSERAAKRQARAVAKAEQDIMQKSQQRFVPIQDLLPLKRNPRGTNLGDVGQP